MPVMSASEHKDKTQRILTPCLHIHFYTFPIFIPTPLSLGPLSASISTDSDSMQFYHGGIMNPKHCSDDVDHAIVIVGMGSSNGVGYWKLRNSWGSDWGEEGYFRMHRAVRESMCGITSDVSYPLVKVL